MLTTSKEEDLAYAVKQLLEPSRVMVPLYGRCNASVKIGCNVFDCFIDTGARFEIIKNENIGFLRDEAQKHKSCNSVFNTIGYIKIDFAMGGQCFREIEFVVSKKRAKAET